MAGTGAGAEEDDLFAEKPKPKRMFGYDWAAGLISPFRPSPDETIQQLLAYLRPTTEVRVCRRFHREVC